tara:strand:+ start:4807 stop:6687 length:1881 start_codon:yes stop_codon:yes gene_type:complete
MPKNTYLSAGVYTREFDLSFLPLDIPAVGAAVIGPAVRGPAMVPVAVSTYSEYLRWFGDVFSSGSGAVEQEYKYLTSYAVQEYLRWGEVCTVTRILAGQYRPAYSNVISRAGRVAEDQGTATYTSNDMSFKLISLSDGDVTNSGTKLASDSGSGAPGDETTGNVLQSGSRYNMRWEVANVDTDRGTFDLYIRRGDDSDFRRVIMEQFVGVSLDPNTTNYIAKVIGDQAYQLRYDSGGAPYLELSGSYPNRSRFVRVEVYQNTLKYLTNDGALRDQALTASLPGGFSGSKAGSTFTEEEIPLSGTFGDGSDGTVAHPKAMNQDIWNLNTQGFNLAAGDGYAKTAYEDAVDIMSNRDQFDFDLLLTPGLIDNLEDHAKIITRAISMVEDRGDAFYIIDPTYKGSTVSQARAAADTRNSSYAGYYYPWVQIADADLGGGRWVPPSAIVPSVYSFNDLVSEKWYAPAGLNRGGLDSGVQTERIMTQNDRDNLYVKNVNPIATFPRHGLVVFGQKTLQKKRSAMDRINVRRLLIAAKRHIAETAKYLVFEQNTRETRLRFINITRPWFEDARRKQGIYDFRIVIDERNNTADVVDRNEMRASIYLKPAKTAEFIIVDFFVLPTGAKFPIDD